MSRKLRILIAIQISLLILCVDVWGDKKVEPVYYFMTVDVNAYAADVKLNGLSLFKNRPGEGAQTDKPVNTWLYPGENVLRVDLSENNEDSIGTGKISVTLYLHDKTSETPKAEKMLAVLQLPDDDLKFDEPYATRSVAFDYDGSVSKVWSEAAVIEAIVPDDSEEIFRLVSSLQSALLAGDVDKAIALQAYKITEDAEAEGKDPERIKKATRMNYEWLAKQNGVKGLVFSKEDLAFQLGDHKKIIYVTKKNGQNPVQMENDDLFFEVPVYVAKVDDEWKIVR